MILAACVVGGPRAQPGSAVSLSAMLETPERHVGRMVDVVIVEPLRGPQTAAALASAPYGYVSVDVPDGGPRNVLLVPSTFALRDPDRYKRKFDSPLRSPLRVRGEWMVDKENGPRETWVIRVASCEAVEPPAPRVVKGLSEIDADPARWDRQRIVYEGTYAQAFEISALDRSIWLGFQASTSVVRPPAQRAGTHKVRVTGYLYAKRGGAYGHLGGYRCMLFADTIEYL